MGVVHFVTLGKSIGAVTVGITYCVENYKKWKEKKSEILEGVVIITTEDMKNKKEKLELTKNDYGLMYGIKVEKQQSPYEALENYLKEEYGDLICQNNGKIEYCLVDIRGFYASVKRIFEKLNEYKSKEIWLNITGGMNTITVQTLFAAYLSGIVAKVYYTYVPQELSRLLKPPSKENSNDFIFIEIPSLRASFDKTLISILKEIEEAQKPITTSELESRLKAQIITLPPDFKEYLKKVVGQGLITFDGNSYKITDAGKALLSLKTQIENLLSKGT